MTVIFHPSTPVAFRATRSTLYSLPSTSSRFASRCSFHEELRDSAMSLDARVPRGRNDHAEAGEEDTPGERTRAIEGGVGGDRQRLKSLHNYNQSACADSHCAPSWYW